MRLIDADKLYPDCMSNKGLAITQSQLANAPTVEIPVARWDAYCEGQKIGYEKGIEERPTGEWIPVSAQEPAVGGIYFVTAKHVSGHIGTDIARRLSDDVWTFGGEELKGTEIIAWQPLPKPFKEAENDI